jgi:flagellum-specific peptidoglycan hydrolase FlgJ
MKLVQKCALCKHPLKDVSYRMRQDNRYVIVCELCYRDAQKPSSWMVRHNAHLRKRYYTDPVYRQRCIDRAAKNQQRKATV